MFTPRGAIVSSFAVITCTWLTYAPDLSL